MAAAVLASGFDDEAIFGAALVTLYVISPLTALALQFLSAPYGKHARPGWGPTLPAQLAWFLMESPTLWLTLLLYPHGRHRSQPLALLLLVLYLLHYLHRTIIYPLKLHWNSNKMIKNMNNEKKNSSGAGFPLVIALIAFFFNLLNAYVQARSVSHYADYPPGEEWWVWARVASGVVIFLWGMAVNINSDRALVRLKAEAGGVYRIPQGGWFELVSCPNYMGEAAEWLGWAVAAWTPAALGFFLYTCANLGPRARAHLLWYREKFGDEFPAQRKAFIPYIY